MLVYPNGMNIEPPTGQGWRRPTLSGGDRSLIELVLFQGGP
jgi:hypothetical protein